MFKTSSLKSSEAMIKKLKKQITALHLKEKATRYKLKSIVRKIKKEKNKKRR